MCAKDPEEGLFDFLVFDNGPAYELYALATVGAVWPKSIYGTPEPPSANIAEARHHASLRKDIVPLLTCGFGSPTSALAVSQKSEQLPRGLRRLRRSPEVRAGSNQCTDAADSNA